MTLEDRVIVFNAENLAMIYDPKRQPGLRNAHEPSV